MTTRELIEMASLDAMGMLEDGERAAFERAFAAASPGVQRQVRREQGRLASADGLLPDVDAPAGLRARVILAVCDAMRGVAARDGADVLARLAPAGLALRRNVSPLWRAACIGFATATIVLMAAGYSLQQEWSRAAAAAQGADIASLASNLGPDFADALTNPNTSRVAFLPASTDSGGRSGSATIYFDAETGKAWLICNRLPVIEGAYRLALLGPAGEVVETITEFTYQGGMGAQPIQRLALRPGATLAIVPPLSASPLLVSAGV